MAHTRTDRMKTPPGPHAMTAQAGAVAFAWYLRTGHGDSIHFGTEPPECLLSHKWKPLYATPPAAVPVEALEGLVGEWRNLAKTGTFTNGSGEAFREALNDCADELTQLIKERSNG